LLSSELSMLSISEASRTLSPSSYMV
jgi:hypothetical protein